MDHKDERPKPASLILCIACNKFTTLHNKKCPTCGADLSFQAELATTEKGFEK